MNEPTLAAQCREPIFPLRLTHENGHFVAGPPAKTPDAFTPFALPMLPRSSTDRIALLLEWVWQRHRRAAGFLLFVDADQRRWACGVPKQRAGAEASSWNALRSDFPGLPAPCYVAGSFQSRVFQSGEDITDAVPPSDGLHFILNIERDARSIWCFARAGGGPPLAVLPGAVLHDDLEQDFKDLCDRLVFI